MIAINSSVAELVQVLNDINEEYAGNIRFNRYPEKVGNRLRFTLRVSDSKRIGARVGHTGRRLISACYHAHGHFFEALFKRNPNAKIISRGKTITANAGNWNDCNIGSIMQPLYFSEACKCAEINELIEAF